MNLSGPVVLAGTVHVPPGVIVAAASFIIGLASLFGAARRFQRDFAYRWFAVLMAAAVVVLGSAIVLVAFVLRSVA
ncbi:hypothetical protein [uncultured Amnibacterium sp.]|uniref:hypothetical protein n=1 Tax=uncultured Amnibacterium sp. TaxID=1631851 RepID=UPI0035CC5F12